MRPSQSIALAAGLLLAKSTDASQTVITLHPPKEPPTVTLDTPDGPGGPGRHARHFGNNRPALDRARRDRRKKIARRSRSQNQRAK